MIRKFTFVALALLSVLSVPAYADCYESGVTDQVLAFKAVDVVDLETPETGLTSFTVYRTRFGGTSTIFTTPTTAEPSSANQPGIYWLTLDEDMTIGAGNDREQMLFTISHASMAPVDVAISICRNKTTAGETQTVSGGFGYSNLRTTAASAITATSIAANAIGSSEMDASANAAIAAAVMAETCEDQNGGYTVQECLSILLAEAAGTAVYTSGTRTWVVSDPSGTETRLTLVYGAELDGDRDTSTPAPITP